MSNQPKMVYRSDTTGRNYNMWLKNGHFTIQVEPRSGDGGFTSDPFECLYPFRRTMNKFMDLVENHINTGKWENTDVRHRSHIG